MGKRAEAKLKNNTVVFIIAVKNDGQDARRQHAERKNVKAVEKDSPYQL